MADNETLKAQELAHLKENSPYALPDNPSDSNWSAGAIKQKHYKGLFYLLSLLQTLRDELEDEDSSLEEAIATLESYFTDGIAKKATADANGNVITSTYETKTNVQNVLDQLNALITALSNGTTVVARARADASGNSISDSYASRLVHTGNSGSDSSLSFTWTMYSKSGSALSTVTQSLPVATQSNMGFMSKADKTKLDGLDGNISTLQGNIDSSGHYLGISGGVGTDYAYTISLKDANNNTLSSITFDLPIENVVVGGSYDSVNKKVILTLDNGNTIEFSVEDLVSGLVSQGTFDALELRVSNVESGKVNYSDISTSGGAVVSITKSGTSYSVAENVSISTIPQVVQSTTDLPASNDGYLYLVLDNGYLYYYDNGWVQGYLYTSDLLTITEVDIDED